MVHPFRINGYNLVLDVESGAVHLMDELSFDMVSTHVGGLPGDSELLSQYKDKYDEDEISAAIKELRELIDGNMLYVGAPDYDAALFSKLLPIKAMCLHVAHDCNLRCKYCFASQGDYHGERGIMSPETSIKAIDFLLKSSSGRRNLEVDFFGGEPTLAMDTVRKTVA